METLSPPHPAINLSTPLYYQLVHTLTRLLPPPLDDSQEALYVRNHAAIAKVAALLPVNANEADFAAQCIAARAQAEDMLRLLRQHAGDDINVVLRLNAQYASMVRTSLSVHGRLMRVQALRQKREAIDATANQDAWTQHVAEQSMLVVFNPNAGLPEPAWPAAVPDPAPAPAATPVEAVAAGVDQEIEENSFVFETNISEEETISQDAAFETWLSEQPWNQGAEALNQTGLNTPHSEAKAKAPLQHDEAPANGPETPATTHQAAHVDSQVAST